MNKVIKIISVIAVILIAAGLFAAQVRAAGISDSSTAGASAGTISDSSVSGSSSGSISDTSSDGSSAGSISDSSSNGSHGGSISDTSTDGSSAGHNGGSISDTSTDGSTSGGAGTISDTSTDGSSSGTPTPSTQPENNGGGNGSGGSSGGHRAKTASSVTISDLKITKVNETTLTVAWTTSLPVIGKIVYGPVSNVNVTGENANLGYASASVETVLGTSHNVTITIAPGLTYFVRPIAILGKVIYFGNEITLAPTSTSVNTQTTTIGTSVSTTGTSFGSVKLTPVKSSSPEVTGNENVASANLSLGAKIGAFFKKIWNFLLGR